MTNYHWGIIGLGRMAHTFAKFFPQDQTLAAVAAHDPERAKQFAHAFQVSTAYPDYTALFADPTIDIVYVATTHNFHYDNIKAALLAGKHVLAEKSITLNARELRKLMALAEQKHLILMEAQTIYHLPLYPALDDATQSLGALKSLQVSLGIQATDPKDRLLNPELGGGALLDLGIYAFSWIRRMMQTQAQLVATQMARTATGVDGQSSFLLTNAAGVQATIQLNLQAPMPKSGLAVYENGFVTIDNYPKADRAIINLPGQEPHVLQAGDWHHSLAYEVQDMAQAVETGVNPTLAWTLDTMTLMSQARETWGYYYPNEQPGLA